MNEQVSTGIPHEPEQLAERTHGDHMTGTWKGWNIQRLLGRGAYGSVYLLEKDGRYTALKVMKVPEDDAEYALLMREYVTEDALQGYFRDMTKRLRKEIEIMMESREQPNIVRIYQYDVQEQEDGFGFTMFIQMEYLTPLPQYLETHYLKEKEFVRIGIDLCNALEFCHQSKLIHRDIKPDNIFITEDGTAKLGDFGMACYLDYSKSYMSIKGSTAYMAPEVYIGKRYDHRADLYSLALTLYRELNMGREPFVSTSKSVISFDEKEKAVKARLVGKKIPAPAEASLAFWTILKKALHAEPHKRYDSAASMKKDMLRLQMGSFKRTGLNKRQRKTVLGMTGVMAAAMITVCMLVYFQNVRKRKEIENAARLQRYTLAYDHKLMGILRDRDYEAFVKDFSGYSRADFDELCRVCYDEKLTEARFFELAKESGKGHGLAKDSMIHYVEVLHYAAVGEYPDPESRVDASRLTYTILDDGNNYYLTTQNSDLIHSLVSKMPSAYQEAVEAGRNTEDYAFAHHWDDKELTFDKVVGFEITSIWQNEDRSMSVQVLIMNGTNGQRIVNDMDYEFFDQDLGVIATGNCGDEYVIEPGTSRTFEMRVPADEVTTGWNQWHDVRAWFSPNID